MYSTSIIKGFRGKKLFSQEKVADLMGMSRQTYNSLENDLLHNDFELVFRLLEVLDLNNRDINDFFNALKQDYMSYKTNLKET